MREILKHPLKEFLVLDLRALGLFRIFFGLVLVVDFIDRLKDVHIFYSSEGVVYPSLFSGNVFSNNTFSLNFLSGDPAFQALILLVGLFLAISFTFGYLTKVSNILLWIIVVSLHNINVMILQGGDDYMRLLLFWAMFLPLGRRFAIDSLHNKFTNINRYFSVANLGLIFQIAFLYFFTAMLKDSPIWTYDYTAVYYALSLDPFRTPIGDIILSIQWLPTILTFVAINIERVVPFLILLPFYNQFTRTFAVLLILGLHLGIGAAMDVGPFSWVCMAAALALIPTPAIDLFLDLLRNKLPPKYKTKAITIREKLTNLFKKLPYIVISVKSRLKREKLKRIVSTSVSTSVIFSLLSFVLITNVNTIGFSYNLGELPSKIIRFLRIDQSWKMFAPYPTFEGGWTVIVGYDEDDNSYDLYQGNSRDTKPENVYNNPKNERWRKYTMNLWNASRYETERVYLLGYYCRQSWRGNLETPPLVKLEMYHELLLSQPDYQEKMHSEKLLTTMECSSEDDTVPVGP